jgi:putative transposase
MHQLGSAGMYFVTASTLHQAHHFKGKERLAVLHRGVLKVAANFGWRLEAWAIFSNHYHFVTQSPELEDNAKSLGRMLSLFHEKTAKWVNRLDHAQGRQV